MAQATPSTAKRVPPAIGIAAFGVAFALIIGVLQPLGVIGQNDAPSSLVGEYAVNIRKDDVPQDLANGNNLIGNWRFTFTADGAYSGERQDVGELISGSYAVENATVTITDEGGLIACSNPTAQSGDQGDVAEGSYQWTRTGERLSLVPIEDDCASRRILLATREFEAFVACLIEAAAPDDTTTQVAEAAASPVADSPFSSLLGSPEAEAASPVAEGASPEAAGATDEAIDALLDQMTACWATGEPQRFIPLMSLAFRDQFLAGDTSGDPIQALSNLMATTPFAWTRAGDITVVDATHATAIVRQAVGPVEDFLRYLFVFEDGAWRWDGTG